MVRTIRDRVLAVLLVSVVGVFAPAEARAQAVFTDLDVPGVPSGAVVPWSVNNSGRVVGYFYDSKSNPHGFVWSAGAVSAVDVPGALSTTARGLNDAGDVVGNYLTPNFTGHAFRLSNGQFTTIDVPGIVGMSPYAVNNAGAIVGYYSVGGTNRGFLLAQGSFSPISVPGSRTTLAFAINDAGTIVGNYWDSANIGHGFVFSAGQYTTLDPPGTGCSGCGSSTPWKVNNTGTIAGTMTGPAGRHGFLWAAGRFTTFSPPNSIYDDIFGINDLGDAVGDYIVGSTQHGYTASRLALLDPVSELRDGQSVTTDVDRLATKGRRVTGVAADGVARVVLRIPASAAGQSFNLTLFNDQRPAAPSQSTDEDGALGAIGSDSITRSDITVTSVDTSAGPYALAIYRAPVDFPRDAGQDAALASRIVSIRVGFPNGSGGSVPLTIVRPPVVMIHGLWDDWTTWNTFAPLVTGPSNVDPRFSIGRLNYNAVVGKLIVSSTPRYSFTQTRRARANAFGFQFNAPSVLAQLQQWVEGFKTGTNPLGIAVAAVQADVIAHSMGGNIARTLPLQKNFYGGATYGAGAIHKLVTIDTPHLGSTLATRLLSPQEMGNCLQQILARRQRHVFASAKLRGIGIVNGAVNDLVDRPLSTALAALRIQTDQRLPTSLVAGVYTDFANLNHSVNASLIRIVPGCWRDPLAQQLTATGWPAVFGGQATDAVVSEFSQLNGTVGLGAEFLGLVHSMGAEEFGFSAPSVLDSPSVSEYVIALLNTAVTQSAYRDLLKPF
jgi:hypothetical protein